MSETMLGTTEPNSSSVANSWSPKLVSISIASLIGLAIGASVVGAISPLIPFENLPEQGISPPPELVEKYRVATYAYHSINLGLNLGVMGLCFGLAFGLITSHRNRPVTAIAGGIGGLVAGAISGYLTGLYVAKAFIASADQSLVESTLIHFASWAGILVGAVLIVGITQTGMPKAASFLVAGIVAAILFSVSHNLVTSMAFPKANLLSVIPATLPERIVWALVLTLTVTCGLHLGLKEKTAPASH